VTSAHRRFRRIATDDYELHSFAEMVWECFHVELRQK
jgi:hypothetical protein